MYIKNLLHIPRLFYTDLLFYPDNDLSWLSNSLFSFSIDSSGI